ncbi:MAG: DUF4296 domain-containing protein [Alistipes sp.]|nr:DUF4296 domain-containing protein [Alistipes sp.]
MIKRALYLLLTVVALGLTSCNEKSIIPDDTLADIFHDAFLVNAYIGEEHPNIDSLRIYEPIFNRYGYTSEDVVHTIGNFSRRKSVRLGSIVEQAIERLAAESKEYEKKVVILDTIRDVAVRSFKHLVYSDSLIVAKTKADSTRLRIEITPAPRGEYEIRYRYTCEDDLKEYPRNAEFYFTDENGYQKSRASVTINSSALINRTLVTNEDCRSLVLNLGKYTERRPATQQFEVKNLKVYRKLKEDDAIDSLFNKAMNLKIFVDGFLIKKDSLALSPDTARVSGSTADND